MANGGFSRSSRSEGARVDIVMIPDSTGTTATRPQSPPLNVQAEQPIARRASGLRAASHTSGDAITTSEFTHSTDAGLTGRSFRRVQTNFYQPNQVVRGVPTHATSELMPPPTRRAENRVQPPFWGRQRARASPRLSSPLRAQFEAEYRAVYDPLTPIRTATRSAHYVLDMLHQAEVALPPEKLRAFFSQSVFVHNYAARHLASDDDSIELHVAGLERLQNIAQVAHVLDDGQRVSVHRLVLDALKNHPLTLAQQTRIALPLLREHQANTCTFGPAAHAVIFGLLKEIVARCQSSRPPVAAAKELLVPCIRHALRVMHLPEAALDQSERFNILRTAGVIERWPELNSSDRLCVGLDLLAALTRNPGARESELFNTIARSMASGGARYSQAQKNAVSQAIIQTHRILNARLQTLPQQSAE